MNAKWYIAGILIILCVVSGFFVGKCTYQRTAVNTVTLVHDTLNVRDTVKTVKYIAKINTVTNEVLIFEPDPAKDRELDSVRAIAQKLNIVYYGMMDTTIQNVKITLQEFFSPKTEQFYPIIEAVFTDTTRTETTNFSTGHGWLTDVLFVALGMAGMAVFSIFFLR
jgi:hypothetical protein